MGMGLEKELSLHLRTGDAPAGEGVKFRQRPTHFLMTTPESLTVMLAQESDARPGNCQFVILDELHFFAGNKRGADLTFSLERLERLRNQTNRSRRLSVASGFPRLPRHSDPASAIERIYRKMYAKVESAAAGRNRDE
jgi:Lhr-like helicase